MLVPSRRSDVLPAVHTRLRGELEFTKRVSLMVEVFFFLSPFFVFMEKRLVLEMKHVRGAFKPSDGLLLGPH